MSNLSLIDSENLPAHVAITMDGNGRWAEMRKQPRTFGHDQGLHTVKKIVKTAADLGVKNLTLYVFSTENWKRAETEVGFLMGLIHKHLVNEFNFYKENRIKLHQIGDYDSLPKQIQDDISDALEKTKDFESMTLTLAINYGGQDEIIRGIKKFVQSDMDVNELNEKNFSQFLDLGTIPPVDLLIRTGGEKRLSNFLLWHIAYAEQIYTDTLWPDYNNEEFYQHIYEYQHRNRRFGAEKPSKQNK